MADKKELPLAMARVLVEYTDEDHWLSTKELTKILEDEYGLVVATDLKMKDAESGETITIPSGTVISLKNTDGRGGTLLWPGIGVNTSSAYFAGTLEGNGCTVLDMSMIDEAGSNGGLFNYCIDASISGILLCRKKQSSSIV